MAEPSPCQLEPDGADWHLSGDLVFRSVPEVLRQSQQRIDFAQTQQIHLSQVAHADSAGLALLLEWQEQARRAGGSLRFVDTPEALLSIARLCNVEALLGD